jgi:hypothetical protein
LKAKSRVCGECHRSQLSVTINQRPGSVNLQIVMAQGNPNQEICGSDLFLLRSSPATKAGAPYLTTFFVCRFLWGDVGSHTTFSMRLQDFAPIPER